MSQNFGEISSRTGKSSEDKKFVREKREREMRIENAYIYTCLILLNRV